MTVVIKINAKTPAPGVTVRAWRDILRSAFAAAGRLWHNEMLPKHFGSNARRNYPGLYKKRTVKWLLRKMKIAPSEIRRAMPYQPAGRLTAADRAAYWREYAKTAETVIEARGGNNYLVFTGTLRQLSRLATFRAFPSRFSVVIQGTAYTPSRPKPSSNQPNIREELTATTKTERDQLNRIVTKKIREGIKFFFQNGHVPAAERQGIF